MVETYDAVKIDDVCKSMGREHLLSNFELLGELLYKMV